MNISIALCTYNGGRFLPEQLASLVAQTRRPAEVVVCDDASTDDTAALLDKFSSEAPFPVRLYYNRRNLGSTGNFEQAISLCEGDAIALCDQDDIWRPQKLERIEALLEREPDIALVFSDSDVVDEDARPLGYRLWQALKFGSQLQSTVASGGAFELLGQRQLITGATMVFRADFRRLILPIPRNLTIIHDAWIAWAISAVGRLGMINEPLIKYRLHRGQQIGVPLLNSASPRLSQRIRQSNDFLPEITRLRAIRDRLASINGYHFAGAPDLDNRLKHLEARASLCGSKAADLPLVVKELITWRYHRYSKGILSALKDLLC